jgi:hypothetical protein
MSMIGGDAPGSGCLLRWTNHSTRNKVRCKFIEKFFQAIICYTINQQGRYEHSSCAQAQTTYNGTGHHMGWRC